ncbi:MAG: hypothetical protein ACTHU0_18325 [Kofleriaceae bacterium]
MPTEHKAYPFIDQVVAFDADDCGPQLVKLTCVAALTPSLNYPRPRLTLCTKLGTLSLTAQQAAELRDQLDRGIADVVAACPEMGPVGDQRDVVDAVNELIATAIKLEHGDMMAAATSLMRAAVILGHQLGVTCDAMVATVEYLYAKCVDPVVVAEDKEIGRG